MRVAVVSDVHGNLTALEAVLADLRRVSPDVVLHGGDLALSGPRPAEVVDLIRGEGWAGVVGNTDELLWRPEELRRQEDRAPRLGPLLHVLFEAFAPATRELLGEDRMSLLRALPRELHLSGIALLHAAPGDLWRAPMPDAEDGTLREVYGGLGSDVVVYGHIHRPFVRDLGGLVVANSGSAGLPYDNDPRAAYLLIDDGRAVVRRVAYDVEAEAEAHLRSDYPFTGWLAEMRRRGAFLPPPVS